MRKYKYCPMKGMIRIQIYLLVRNLLLKVPAFYVNKYDID